MRHKGPFYHGEAKEGEYTTEKCEFCKEVMEFHYDRHWGYHLRCINCENIETCIPQDLTEDQTSWLISNLSLREE